MSDPVTRLNAALSGRYRIERQLGEGGMATVYLADDLRHERKVALKVLKPELAAVVGADRFLAEIKTTANLQHPHILPLHDSGDADGFVFYVMPYVDGESLRDKLDREGQLHVDEAVAIATKVAGALQAAHDQGVIHRDIKPANILLSGGEPLVSDFGIALAVSSAGSGRLTETGLSMGTPYYMSPEQAAADREPAAASDVYTLGCVLFEMLVGDPPHTGSSAQAVLVKILTGDTPSPTEARPSVAHNVDAAIRKALSKLPADRFASARELASALQDESFRLAGASTAPVSRSGAAAFAAVTLVTMTSMVLAIWSWTRAGNPPAEPSWLDVRLPDAAPMTLRGAVGARYFRSVAISPDGRRLAYIAESADGDYSVYTRTRNSPTFRQLPGTDGSVALDFSPDGESLAFVANHQLRRTPFEGGDIVTLGEVDVGSYAFTGLSWSQPGTIVVGIAPGVVTVDPISGARSPTAATCEQILLECWNPDPLPDGEWVLVSSFQDVAIVSMVTGERRTLVDSLFEPHARLLPSGDVAFFQQPGELFILPFDMATLTPRGPAVPMLQGVRQSEEGQYDVSSNGTLVYAQGGGHLRSRLTWIDLNGREEQLPFPATSHVSSP